MKKINLKTSEIIQKISDGAQKPKITKKVFNIKGMHCSSCAKLIVSELEDKVAKLKVEDNGNASIEFDEKKISEQQIKDIIKELGYQA